MKVRLRMQRLTQGGCAVVRCSQGAQYFNGHNGVNGRQGKGIKVGAAAADDVRAEGTLGLPMILW